MPTKIQFCTLHRIGFNTDLDPICPQCSLSHSGAFKSVDYDSAAQLPLDVSGKPVKPGDLVPERI